VARLKGNLPTLAQAVQVRFGPMAPTTTLHVGQDRVELWDADDFDPWETLRWPTVRVVRYRQHKPDGTVVEADWLTDWPTRQVGALSLYRMAKSRWEIENQGFNDAKTRYGMAHIRHHHENSVLVSWLLLALAMTIERLVPAALPPPRHPPDLPPDRLGEAPLAQPGLTPRASRPRLSPSPRSAGPLPSLVVRSPRPDPLLRMPRSARKWPHRPVRAEPGARPRRSRGAQRTTRATSEMAAQYAYLLT